MGSAMDSHLVESHLLVFGAELFVNISMLSSARLTSLVDTLLLKNPFRLGRYNKFKKRVNMLVKEENEEAEEKRRVSLVSKLESFLEDKSMMPKRRYKVRSDKGIKRGKIMSKISKPKVTYSCEVCSYKSNGMIYIRRHTRIHTGEKPYK